MYFALHTVVRPHVGARLAKRQNDVTMPQASKVNVAYGFLTDKGVMSGFKVSHTNFKTSSVSSRLKS